MIGGSGNGQDNKCLRAERDRWFTEWLRQQVTEGGKGLVVQGMAKTTSDRGQRGISGSENGQATSV